MQVIELPWGAWFLDRKERFEFPDEFQIDVFNIKRKDPLTIQQIQQALQPLWPRLEQKQARSVVIVVDDLTRPVFLAEMLEQLLNELEKRNIDSSNITILFGLGAHRPLTPEEMAKKVGEKIVKKYRCVNHSPEETVPIGVDWGKVQVKLNRHFVEAEFKIVISGLTPHSFAGFSGGAKMLIPGLADMEIIAKTHKSVLMGFMGKLGEVENNRFRRVIEQLIETVGIDFFIGVVLNGDRTIADLFTGDFVEAHRNAARAAMEIYAVQRTNTEPYDLIVLNAFPKDTELLQAENGFIPLKSGAANWLKEEALVLLTAACPEGIGYHGLFGPGGKLYHPPRPLRFLQKRPLLFYSPNVSEEDFFKLYWKEYHYFSDKQTLMNHLIQNLPKKARVAVFTFGSLQIVKV